MTTGSRAPWSRSRPRDFEGACADSAADGETHARRRDVWNLLGICESETESRSCGRDAFWRRLKVAPDSVPLHENLGLLYFNDGRLRAARRCLEKAVALGSTRARRRLQPGSFGDSHRRTKRRVGRLLKLEEPLALSRRTGRNADGSSSGSRVQPLRPRASIAHLALDPEDARALNGAASAAEAQHEDEKALSFLLRARKAQPDDIRTLTHFGALCLRKDLTVDALDALEQAHNLRRRIISRCSFTHGRRLPFSNGNALTTCYRVRPARAQLCAGAIRVRAGWTETEPAPVEARQHLEKSLATRFRS